MKTHTPVLFLAFFALLILSCSKSVVSDVSVQKEGDKNNYNRQSADYFLKAMQYREMGNLYGAIVEFQNAYNVHNDSYIQLEIAQCYFYLKQFKNAEQAIKMALVSDPLKEDLLFWQLKVLQAEKKHQESIEVLNTLIKINPEKIEYYYYLMELQYSSNDFTSAAQTVKAAISVSASKIEKKDLYARLADIALKQDRKDEAEITYGDFLAKVDSNDLAILTRYSSLLFSQKKYLPTIELQKKILALDYDNIEQHAMLFWLQNNFGDKKEAELTILSSVKKFNDDGLKLNLGRFYAAQKDTMKARVIYQSLLKCDSGDVLIYNELAGMYDNIGNKLMAVDVYKQAYQNFPDHHSILNNYAYILSEIDLNLDFALNLSKKSLEIEPNSASYLDTFGWINFKLGHYSEAEKYILLAIENDTAKTQLFVLYEHLGDVKIKLDKKKEALECYQKAQELNPQIQEVLKGKINNLK